MIRWTGTWGSSDIWGDTVTRGCNGFGMHLDQGTHWDLGVHWDVVRRLHWEKRVPWDLGCTLG